MDIKLRKVGKEEINLLELHKLDIIVKGNPNENVVKEELEQIKKYIKKEVNENLDNYKIIEINNKVVGDILVLKYKDGILIDTIYILDEYRNKKIGSELLINIINDSTTNIYLWVYKANVYAIKLYEKLGFKVIEKTQTRYCMKIEK